MIVAGEASADQHGESLVQALRAQRPGIATWGAGGDSMARAGFEVVVPARKLAVAGLTEVVFALPRIAWQMRKLVREARRRRPAVIVLMDLPDFNLRLAKRLHPLQIPIVYYISPQLWAWRPKRVEQIKAWVTQMLCILPFEHAFYLKHGVRAQFVGHPLVEQLPPSPNRARARQTLGISGTEGPVIALLPGSREQEVKRHLPIMLRSVQLLKRRHPDLQSIIPVANTIRRQSVERLIRRHKVPAVVVDAQAVDALSASDVAVVCSGTATLQAALLSRPMVVVYRVSWLTYFLLKRMVKVPFISLVNLIAGRKVVPELVQGELTAARVDEEVRHTLEDPLLRVRLTQDYTEIRQALGRGGTAATVARVVLDYVPERRRTTQPVPGTLPAVRAVGHPEDR